MAEVAPEPRQLVTDLGDGAGGIVAQSRDQYRDTTGPVALVHDLCVMDALELTCPLLDRPLDVVLGHRPGLGRIDRGSEPRIVVGVAAGQLRGHRDLAYELGELRASLGVGRSLVVLDLLPLGMAGHDQLG